MTQQRTRHSQHMKTKIMQIAIPLAASFASIAFSRPAHLLLVQATANKPATAAVVKHTSPSPAWKGRCNPEAQKQLDLAQGAME